jgi:hypothetical protein
MVSVYRSCVSWALLQPAAQACSCSSPTSLQQQHLLSQPPTSAACVAVVAVPLQLQGAVCPSSGLWMCTCLCMWRACHSR